MFFSQLTPLKSLFTYFQVYMLPSLHALLSYLFSMCYNKHMKDPQDKIKVKNKTISLSKQQQQQQNHGIHFAGPILLAWALYQWIVIVNRWLVKCGTRWSLFCLSPGTVFTCGSYVCCNSW